MDVNEVEENFFAPGDAKVSESDIFLSFNNFMDSFFLRSLPKTLKIS